MQLHAAESAQAAVAEAPDVMSAIAQLLAARQVKQAAAMATASGDVRLSILILQVCTQRGRR